MTDLNDPGIDDRDRGSTGFRDLTGLPKAKPSAGEAPDEESRFGRVLVDKWHAEAVERDARFRDADQHGIAGVRFYHSNASACSRAVAYAALGLPESNPVDGPGHFIMRLGSLIHTYWQEAMQEAYPNTKVEVTVTDDGGEMGGHADVEIPDHGGKPWHVSIELKSMGGTGYSIAVGDRSAGKGPRFSHRVQCCLNAKAANADEAVLVYLARDAIGITNAKKRKLPSMMRVVAEWSWNREQLTAIADEEIDRITKILALVDGGTLPARKTPELQAKHRPHNHVIENPASGAVTVYDIDDKGEEQLVDHDTNWSCVYCRYQTTCARTGAHRDPVERLVEIGALDREALSGGHRE